MHCPLLSEFVTSYFEVVIIRSNSNSRKAYLVGITLPGEEEVGERSFLCDLLFIFENDLVF